jgi:hypothetical protein
MERVTYLLGAGFSAPLGVPVMGNFFERARELHQNHPDQFGHFKDVLQSFRDLQICKTYYDADLLNIEEILSILELREGIKGKSGAQPFLRFIADVIRAHTSEFPAPPKYHRLAGSWLESVFGRRIWSLYGGFVASLFNLQFSVSWPGPEQAVIKFTQHPGAARYSVITLNYDLILETACSFLNKHHTTDVPLGFHTDFSRDLPSNAVPLAKLHGSIDSGEIIAPTWNKSLHPNLIKTWDAAHKLLAEATQIRILGYSLPVADAYIKYLLKSAAVDSMALKRIDVICLDSGGIQQRYFDFIHFKGRRFKNANISGYMQQVFDTSMDWGHYGTERHFNQLEAVHEHFMVSA